MESVHIKHPGWMHDKPLAQSGRVTDVGAKVASMRQQRTMAEAYTECMEMQ